MKNKEKVKKPKLQVMKSYRFRLYPTPEQETLLKQHGGTIRFVWNQLVAFAQEYKQSNGKYPSQSKLQTYILQLKAKFDFIKIPHSQPVQINALRLVAAITRAFTKENKTERAKRIAIAQDEQDDKKLAKALNYAMPKFKRKADNQDNIFYAQYPQGFQIKKSHIHFAKLGWIKFIRSAEIQGIPKTANIVKDGDHWFCTIACQCKVKDITKKSVAESNIVGLDLGLTDFVVVSDGEVIKPAKTLKKNLKKLKRESRKLSRKERNETGEVTHAGKPISEYSGKGKKQAQKVNRLHRKIRNIRTDFLHQTSYRIITKYDGVAIEDLDIRGMLKKNNKAMNRSTSDVAWGRFGKMLEYKAVLYSKYFVKIDRYSPSTQRCHGCKSLQTMRLEDREYICPVCGARQPRDLNAARNVQTEGVGILLQREQEEQAVKAEALKNTVGITEIYARGDLPIGESIKREKVLSGH